jgi:hypothetical protein
LGDVSNVVVIKNQNTCTHVLFTATLRIYGQPRRRLYYIFLIFFFLNYFNERLTSYVYREGTNTRLCTPQDKIRNKTYKEQNAKAYNELLHIYYIQCSNWEKLSRGTQYNDLKTAYHVCNYLTRARGGFRPSFSPKNLNIF